MLRDPRLRRRFIDTSTLRSDRRPHWCPAAIQRYFGEVVRFKKDMLVLVQISGGGVACSSELITMQYRNSSTSEGRGIYVTDDMVHFVTKYYKGYRNSAKPKIIHRFVLREVGELVVYYLWLVQPFVKAL